MKEREEIKKVWEKQPEKFPFFLQENPDIFPKIDLERKKENETFVQALSERLRKKYQQRPKEEERREQWEQELEQDLWDFLKKEKILFITEWMSEEKLAAFKRETRRFVEQVRGFDQTLNQAQIWQALRNYFIYAILVDMQGEEQNAGEPILAYSLLYPYTDNYIDDERVSRQEKERYNRMIALKLKGGNVLPQNPLEEKTCCLLDMIGKVYKETKRLKVESVLLQLLEAQNCSIRQQKTEITEAEILDISIWKGSSSVLADYLFSTENWLEREERFYLKFGFLLQLVDDLQDIEEDQKAGSRTLMTKAAEQKRLEQRMNRLLWFGWNVIREFEPRNPELKGFVVKNCVEVTLFAASMNPQFFSKEYLKTFEPYLPFTLEFLKKMKKKQKKSRYGIQIDGNNSVKQVVNSRNI